MSLPELPGEADAVVIGTGAFGVSAAYHLAAMGLRRVVALDRFAAASQASPRAAGLFKVIQHDELRTRLSRLSIDKMLRFEQDTGVPLPVHRSGSLLVGESERYGDSVRVEYERSRAWGVELEMVGPEEAHRVMPFFKGNGADAVCWCPGDIYIEEPKTLLNAYLEAGARLGLTVFPFTPVTGIRSHQGEVQAVITDRGEIRTPIVVDAAGAWVRMVASLADAFVAVQPVRHQLYISQPITGIEASQPILRLIDHAVYIRPSRSGLMLGAFERDPLPLDVRDQPADFSTDDVPLDLTVLQRLTDAVDDRVPALHDAPVAEHRGGLFTMTPDGTFIAGPAPEVRGFWVLTGCNGSGFSFSPALGQLLAEWITAGSPSLDITPLSPARFQPPPSDDDLCRLGVWQYAHFYDPPSAIDSASL